MSEPKFHYQPDNKEETRFTVYAAASGFDAADVLQGEVYQTADGGWVADWEKRGTSIAMPGFQTKEYAAGALYWFSPPQQSLGSRPAGQKLHAMDEHPMDESLCGCCVNNRCECEGTDRLSQRFGIPDSYQIRPSLIPVPGVLYTLLPLKGGDFLVDANTRGTGHGIGHLQQRDDGRYDVRLHTRSIGIADTPETGLYACLQAHTGSKFYARLLKGYEPHEAEPEGGWVKGTITFRAETVEHARSLVHATVACMHEGPKATASSSKGEAVLHITGN